MYDLLKGLRVVEGSAFVAGPTCGLYLAQLGAEVIRFDNIGGGPDFNRWPLSPKGDSFYWEGLNKSKKSIAIDLSRPEGRRLAQELATAPGDSAGAFVTNFPVEGFLSYEALSEGMSSDAVIERIMAKIAAPAKPLEHEKLAA
jgi:2-methylfumaryl-CoA isomerase